MPLKIRKIHHYRSKTLEYASWIALRGRCNTTDINAPAYAHYVLRGITYDPKWNDFKVFFADMGECPDGHTIERIDNDKGYNKENCKWATIDEQNNNRTDSHKITYKGVTDNLASWARKLGLHQATLTYRLKKGWSIEEAFEIPTQPRWKNDFGMAG